MRFEAFAGRGADDGGFIRDIDSRAKLVFVLACLLLTVVSSNPVSGLAVGAVCIALVTVSGASLKSMAVRMSEPLVFAFILAAMQALLTHGPALYSVGLFGVTLSVSAEGFHKGVIIMSRVFGGVSSVLFLTMTTSAHRLLSAAASLKAPKPLVEVSIFAYRYVFALMEDAVAIYHAQKGRLGYSNLARGVSSLATLSGAVFLRAFNQAEATGESMAMRGYTGEYIPLFNERLRVQDPLILGALFSFCLAVNIWTL